MIRIVILYTTGCPKCKVLKSKLDAKGVQYLENNSVMEMLRLGIRQVPVLKVEEDILDFSAANDWINRQ